MNNPPQSVTERYVSNLIHNGRNKEFDIDLVELKETVVDGTNVGYYFYVNILANPNAQCAYGATIAQAVRKALTKHGVTFR